MAKKAFLVVGAGQAGSRAAEALRTRDPEASILLVGAEHHLPYERPQLSKAVLAGNLAPEALQLKDACFYSSRDIELRLGTYVTGIDPARKRAWLSDATEVHYDGLLIATGSEVRGLAVTGRHLPGIHYLRGIEDAESLRRDLTGARRLAVIGAGFIGLEVAATARSHFDCEVVVLEAGEGVLQRGAPAEMQRGIADLHARHGVEILCGKSVVEFQGDRNVERVVCADGTAVEADCVVVGIGVTPRVEIAKNAGLAVQNGLLVNEYCETSAAGVYGAGEVTSHWNRRLDGPVRFESWQTAQQQPLVAAANMTGERVAYEQIPWFWTDQFGQNFQLLGVTRSVGDPVVRSYRIGEKYIVFYLDGRKLAGAFAMNCGKDIRVAQKWMESGKDVPVDKLGDTSVDLRKLMKRDT